MTKESERAVTAKSGKPDHPELLTYKEAADYLRMSESFVRQLVFRDGIRYIKFGTGRSARVRFSKEDLDDYIAASRIEPEAATR